jgi:hypothetical protein
MMKKFSLAREILLDSCKECVMYTINILMGDVAGAARPGSFFDK